MPFTHHRGDLPYAIHRPDAVEPTDGDGLVLFLHGAGERGDDGLQHLEVGLGPELRRHPDRWPATVLLPQCPRDETWSGDVLRAADELVDAISHDRRRRYLTGISMGGMGTWSLAAMHPERYAAIVPVCGLGDPSSAVDLADLPIRFYHGADDDVIPVKASRAMAAALAAIGATDAVYTEYRDVGHDSWRVAYADPDLPTWLLAQRRSDGLHS